MKYQRGDVFLTRSFTLIGRLVRFFERSKDESKSIVNHTGIIVEDGEDPHIIEALITVKHRPLSEGYGGKPIDVWVFRNVFLKDEEKEIVSHRALEFSGEKYGVPKIGAHFGDWVLTRLRFWSKNDVYLFRKLAGMSPYPICSWIVGWSYLEIGYLFGIHPEFLTPDDIWDWVSRSPQWECVFKGRL